MSDMSITRGVLPIINIYTGVTRAEGQHIGQQPAGYAETRLEKRTTRSGRRRMWGDCMSSCVRVLPGPIQAHQARRQNAATS